MSEFIETSRGNTKSKVKLSVGIKNPPNIVKSGDFIEGMIHLENAHKRKVQKIKILSTTFWEVYDQWITHKEFNHEKKEWEEKKKYGNFRNNIRTTPIEITQKHLKPGEKIDVPFKFKIVGGLHQHMAKLEPSKNWCAGITIGVKSKLLMSNQYHRILPFDPSDVSANWLD
ncbi:MAG: hypothetical protein ACTSRE_15410 [Promethearchaeota archaeon]